MVQTYEYDIVLSFAGEEREYVEAVAKLLQSFNIKVFYDLFEQANLWGKDLYTHLDDIYRNKARFCVMFISENYKRKIWTNHERKSAQAHAFQENREYILPARFDNTEIPGIHPTVGYIDLQKVSPNQFAKLVIDKLNSSISDILIPNELIQNDINLKPNKQVDDISTYKPIDSNFSQISKIPTNHKYSKTIRKTVNLTVEGISQLLNDKPVVYKILTEGGKNNYTGVAKKGNVRETIQKHLPNGKNYVPGNKVQIERMSSIQEAQQKAGRIIKRSKPKYNKPMK